MPSEAVHRLLFENAQLPVLQNRTYGTQFEARACAKGDVRLVEDLRSGLVYYAAFRPELVVYDDDYQNEQSQSPSFHKHLDSVTHGNDSAAAVCHNRTDGRSNRAGTGWAG